MFSISGFLTPGRVFLCSLADGSFPRGRSIKANLFFSLFTEFTFLDTVSETFSNDWVMLCHHFVDDQLP